MKEGRWKEDVHGMRERRKKENEMEWRKGVGKWNDGRKEKEVQRQRQRGRQRRNEIFGCREVDREGERDE